MEVCSRTRMTLTTEGCTGRCRCFSLPSQVCDDDDGAPEVGENMIAGADDFASLAVPLQDGNSSSDLENQAVDDGNAEVQSRRRRFGDDGVRNIEGRRRFGDDNDGVRNIEQRRVRARRVYLDL